MPARRVRPHLARPRTRPLGGHLRVSGAHVVALTCSSWGRGPILGSMKATAIGGDQTGAAGSGDDLVRWAAAESEVRLRNLGDRWLHFQGVAAKAARVGQAFDGEDRATLLAAAHLHDVGYAPSLKVTGLHQLDGAIHLRALGQERLARRAEARL